MGKDWKKIADDREKYQAYLCSREWSVLKEKVHERAKGMCERCTVFKIDAVHHLTYARKYHESLEDLQGICKHCHEFTHAKAHRDPLRDVAWIRYVRKCRDNGKLPVDREIAWSLSPDAKMSVFEFLHAKAAEFYQFTQEISDEDAYDKLSEYAHEFEICGDILQAGFEQDYIMWLRMNRPAPADWNETWEDAI